MKACDRCDVDDCIKPAHAETLLRRVPLYRLWGPLSNVCATVETLVESTAMTDNDEPAPPRGTPSSAGQEQPGESDARTGRNDGVVRSRTSGVSARIAPTDPEVPSAKRRGALRHTRSLVGLTAVVMGLLTITLALLYRASQQVRARDETTGDAPRSRGTGGGPPVGNVHESTRTPPSPPPSHHSGGEPGDVAPSEDSSNDSVPAGSAPPKSPGPAHDIIRTPAF
jgi:hypothetical protein